MAANNKNFNIVRNRDLRNLGQQKPNIDPRQLDNVLKFETSQYALNQALVDAPLEDPTNGNCKLLEHGWYGVTASTEGLPNFGVANAPLTNTNNTLSRFNGVWTSHDPLRRNFDYMEVNRPNEFFEYENWKTPYTWRRLRIRWDRRRRHSLLTVWHGRYSFLHNTAFLELNLQQVGNIEDFPQVNDDADLGAYFNELFEKTTPVINLPTLIEIPFADETTNVTVDGVLTSDIDDSRIVMKINDSLTYGILMLREDEDSNPMFLQSARNDDLRPVIYRNVEDKAGPVDSDSDLSIIRNLNGCFASHVFVSNRDGRVVYDIRGHEPPPQNTANNNLLFTSTNNLGSHKGPFKYDKFSRIAYDPENSNESNFFKLKYQGRRGLSVPNNKVELKEVPAINENGRQKQWRWPEHPCEFDENGIRIGAFRDEPVYNSVLVNDPDAPFWTDENGNQIENPNPKVLINNLITVNKPANIEEIEHPDYASAGSIVTIRIRTQIGYELAWSKEHQNDGDECSSINGILFCDYEASTMDNNLRIERGFTVSDYDHYGIQEITFAMPLESVEVNLATREVDFEWEILTDDNIRNRDWIGYDEDGNPILELEYVDSEFPIDRASFTYSAGILGYEPNPIDPEYDETDAGIIDFPEISNAFGPINTFGRQKITIPKDLLRNGQLRIDCWAPLRGDVIITGNPWVSERLTAIVQELTGSGEIQWQWMRTLTAEEASRVRSEDSNVNPNDWEEDEDGNIWIYLNGEFTNMHTLLRNYRNVFLETGLFNELDSDYVSSLGLQIKIRVTRPNRLGHVDSLPETIGLIPLLGGTVVIRGNTWASQTLTAEVSGLPTHGEGNRFYRWQYRLNGVWNDYHPISGVLPNPDDPEQTDTPNEDASLFNDTIWSSNRLTLRQGDLDVGKQIRVIVGRGIPTLPDNTFDFIVSEEVGPVTLIPWNATVFISGNPWITHTLRANINTTGMLVNTLGLPDNTEPDVPNIRWQRSENELNDEGEIVWNWNIIRNDGSEIPINEGTGSNTYDPIRVNLEEEIDVELSDLGRFIRVVLIRPNLNYENRGEEISEIPNPDLPQIVVNPNNPGNIDNYGPGTIDEETGLGSNPSDRAIPSVTFGPMIPTPLNGSINILGSPNVWSFLTMVNTITSFGNNETDWDRNIEDEDRPRIVWRRRDQDGISGAGHTFDSYGLDSENGIAESSPDERRTPNNPGQVVEVTIGYPTTESILSETNASTINQGFDENFQIIRVRTTPIQLSQWNAIPRIEGEALLFEEGITNPLTLSINVTGMLRENDRVRFVWQRGIRNATTGVITWANFFEAEPMGFQSYDPNDPPNDANWKSLRPQRLHHLNNLIRVRVIGPPDSTGYEPNGTVEDVNSGIFSNVIGPIHRIPLGSAFISGNVAVGEILSAIFVPNSILPDDFSVNYRWQFQNGTVWDNAPANDLIPNSNPPELVIRPGRGNQTVRLQVSTLPNLNTTANRTPVNITEAVNTTNFTVLQISTRRVFPTPLQGQIEIDLAPNIGTYNVQSIDGVPENGRLLTARLINDNIPTPTGLSPAIPRRWRWFRNGNVITGANSHTYTPTHNDLRSMLEARIEVGTIISGQPQWGSLSAFVGPVEPIRLQGTIAQVFSSPNWLSQVAGTNRSVIVELTNSGNLAGTTGNRPAQHTGFNVTVRSTGTSNILLTGTGSLFRIPSGVTFTTENIIMRGHADNNQPLIRNAGTFTMRGGLISSNANMATASTGTGGGVLQAGGTFNLENGEISANLVWNEGNYNGGGGAINVTGGTCNIFGGILANNMARAFGGAIRVAGGTLNIFGGQISGNRARWRSAGGIFVHSGTVNLRGVVFSSNDGHQVSGAIVTQAGTVNIFSASFFGNATGGNNRNWDRLNGGGLIRVGDSQVNASDNNILNIVNGIWGHSNSTGSSSSGGGCLPLSTLILTAYGYKRLGDLKIGDEIISKSLFGNKLTTDKIWHVWKSDVPMPVYEIKFTDNTSIKCNPSHLFEKRFRGPSTLEQSHSKQYVPTGILKVGNKISTMDHWKTIDSIKYVGEEYIGEIFLEKDYYYYATEQNITSWIASGKAINDYVRDQEMVEFFNWPQVKSRGPWIVSEFAKLILNSWKLISVYEDSRDFSKTV